MPFSVIIPTLNEAGTIAQAIRAVAVQKPGEIIVVDGGSRDGTAAQARQADLVLASPPGRALQMNAGAARARGRFLLFLHADCLLEEGALSQAAHLLENPGLVGGCFTMQVKAGGWLYRGIEACATARVRLGGLIYGDQGLFLRRADFERLGGFPPLKFMEDFFFSRRLRNAGRLTVAKKRIFVSPRRWERTGILRQTLRNWLLTALAAGGVHPDRLSGFYAAWR